MSSRLHDQRIRLFAFEVDAHFVRRREELEELVTGEPGEVIQGGNLVLTESNQHTGSQAFESSQFVADAELATSILKLPVPLLERGACPLLQLCRYRGIETFDIGEVRQRHIGDLFERGEPFGYQQMGNDIVNIESVDEHLAAATELLGTPLRLLGFCQNVDVPAGKLRGETDILTTPPDRQAELIVRDDDFDAPLLLIHDHLGDFGRRERIYNKSSRVGRPGDNVDLFSLQFAHDRLDTAPPHADASSDRVDTAVAGDHSYLGPASGISSDRLDLDDTVINLRNLLREQLRHELRMGSRQENLRPAQFLAHIVNIGAHALTLAEAFARQQFVAAQHCLGAAEVDDDVTELDPLDQPVDDLGNPVLEFEELPLPLGVAHLLHDDLFCCLCGDTTKINRRQRVGYEVADLGFRVQPLRLRQPNLGGLVLDRLGHLAEAEQPYLAVAAINFRSNIVILTVFRAARLLDRLLHGLQDLVAINSFVASNSVRDLQQFRASVGESGVHHRLGVCVASLKIT